MCPLCEDRVYNSDVDMLGNPVFYARHIFYDLLDYFIEDTRPTGNGALVISKILAGTPFVGTSDIENITTAYYQMMSPVKAILGADEETTTALEQAIINAAQLITGNSGGYVVLHPSEKPQEIFIMDTPDMNSAQQVWRWNLSGLGYNSTGINGPFELAMTMDGAIVADFITAETINGALSKPVLLRQKAFLKSTNKALRIR